MKEIIEYLLAAIIILSFIPIYDIINLTMLSPTAKSSLGPGDILYISNGVLNIISNTYGQGNFTPIIDFTSLLRSELGPGSLYYGVHVKIISDGIVNVTYNNGVIDVLTSIKGNLTLLILYGGLTVDTVKLTTYTESYPNGTFLYQTSIPPTYTVLSIVAILENGVARYIAYWLSPIVYRAYILDIGGTVTVAIPQSEPQPLTYTITASATTYSVVNTTLIYYTKGKANKYFSGSYNYWINLTWWQTGSGYSGSGYRAYVNYYYVSRYNGISRIGNSYYYLLSSSRYLTKNIYDERFRVRFGVLTITSSILSASKQAVDPLSFPIYNLVFLVLQDSNGRIYVAIYYPHAIEFGDSIPENWITKTLTYNIRLGLINYKVYVTLWKKST